MALNLSLKTLNNVKICDNECKEKLDNGDLCDLTSKSVVACVGCGRKCHMECHKIPKALVEAVKIVPTNNRIQAFFGDYSYLRMVCDNCANWLMMGLKGDEKPSFLTLFTRMAEKIIHEKYVLKGEVHEEPAPSAAANLNLRKRKKVSEDDTEGTDLLNEMMNLMSTCVAKLDKIEEKCELNAKGNVTGFNSLNEVVVETQKSMNRGMMAICDKMVGMTEKMSEIDGKIETKNDAIENGIQVGFNNLIQKTENLLSPITPMIQACRRNDLRRMATIKSAATQLHTPKARSFSSILETNKGTATDNEAFGSIVPRKLFQKGGDNGQGSFYHEKAIYIRYVDPAITPKKMLDILKKDVAVNEAISKDERNIEITRLTKKALSEDDIRSYKFGVSYRIGASEDIFDTLNNGSMFATHWEIRPWVNKDRKRFDRTNTAGNTQGDADISNESSVGFLDRPAEHQQ